MLAFCSKFISDASAEILSEAVQNHSVTLVTTAE